jgi:hypothetical protein
VLDGEPGGFTASVDVELAVDRAQVPVDGPGAQEQSVCDAGASEALGNSRKISTSRTDSGSVV